MILKYYWDSDSKIKLTDHKDYNKNLSMPKTKIKHNESVSLWNYTLSPGWSRAEVEVLKLALQKFGIGKWASIIKSKCLPGKSIGQIYLQTQRIMGQQSLGDFMGLNIDIQQVFLNNKKKQNVVRKNNCIINTGDNPNKTERAKKILTNKEKYGIDMSVVNAIRLPKKKKSLFGDVIMLEEIETNKFSTVEKIDHLKKLHKLVTYKLDIMAKFGNDYFDNFSLQQRLARTQANQEAAKTSNGKLVLNVKPKINKFKNSTINRANQNVDNEKNLLGKRAAENPAVEEFYVEEMMYQQYLTNKKLANSTKRPVVIALTKISDDQYALKD